MEIAYLSRETLLTSTLLTLLCSSVLFTLIIIVSNRKNSKNKLFQSIKHAYDHLPQLTTLSSHFSDKTQDKPADSTFEVSVVKARYNVLDSRVEYQIIFQYDDKHWDTWRRYNDFRSFQQRHPSTIEPFPGKSTAYDVLSGNENTLEFIESRRKSLDKYLKHVVNTKENFEQLSVLNKESNDRLGPDGMFFAIPRKIDLTNVKTLPTREELVQEGVKAFQRIEKELKLLEDKTVKKPWELLSESPDKKSKCFTWQDGDFLHISVKSKVSCTKVELLELILDNSIRDQWDDNYESQETIDKFLCLHPAEIKKGIAESPENAHLFELYNKLTSEEKLSLKKISTDFTSRFGYKLLFCAVQYNRMESPAPLVVSKRDTVTVSLLVQSSTSGEIMFCLKSLEYNHPTTKTTAEYVRATFIGSATIIKDWGSMDYHFSFQKESLDSNEKMSRPEEQNGKDKTSKECELISITMMDPGTYVPPKIIKMFAPKRANDVPKMGDLARKRSSVKKHQLGKLLV